MQVLSLIKNIANVYHYNRQIKYLLQHLNIHIRLVIFIFKKNTRGREMVITREDGNPTLATMKGSIFNNG